MNLTRTGIMAAGVLTLAVAIGHTFFYRLFGWAADFGKMKPLNQRVLYTIHVALYLLFLPFA